MSDRQWEFLKDIAKLIIWAEENGFKLTEGEGRRTQSQQLLYYYGKEVVEGDDGLKLIPAPKLSKVKHSYHMDGLAHDFNIFVDGRYIGNDGEKARPLGEYWKSLHPDNVWGGDWGWDAGHFERKVRA